MANPELRANEKDKFVRRLMAARRAVRNAKACSDRDAEVRAHHVVDKAERALGDRGAVWWDDGSADFEPRRIAPVTAIKGNVDTADWAIGYADTERIRLGEQSFYVLHDLKTLAIDPRAERLDVIVSGHSHQAAIETVQAFFT